MTTLPLHVLAERLALCLDAQIATLPPDHPAVRLRTLLVTGPSNGGPAAPPQAPELDDDYWLPGDDDADEREGSADV